MVSSDCSRTCSRCVCLRVGDSQGYHQSQFQKGLGAEVRRGSGLAWIVGNSLDMVIPAGLREVASESEEGSRVIEGVASRKGGLEPQADLEQKRPD